MRATLFGALFVSALDTTFLAQRTPDNSSDVAYERNLPTQGSFLEKSHETIQHIRADLKDLFKTVGELRTADLDEVSRQRQNFESQLHSQEDEVKREALANVKLQQDNDAILSEVHKLEEQKKELVEENSQLEKKLKDLKGQVEQEVSGMEALLGSGVHDASILQEASVVGGAASTDEESADDADKDDEGKDDDAADDKEDSKDDDDSDTEDTKDDAKDDSKDDAKDDASDDDKDDSDDDDDDDKLEAKKSLVKTSGKSDAAAKKVDVQKASESDDDEDDGSDKDDDSDDKDDDDDAGSSELQVDADKLEPCKCTTPCNNAAKPICFVESSQCGLKQKCDKGAKGSSCIKTDPVKGPWTFCANLLNVTGAPPQAHQHMLPENPNVAVVMRMMSDIRREIAGISGEDEDGASRLRDAYKDEKQKEERKRKEVMEQQKELQRVQEEDLARKSKLLDEVHSLQERNKNLRQQVDRIGEFLRAESSKLSDAVTAANDAKESA